MNSGAEGGERTAGDADVAHRAGAPTRTTPVEEMQAASVMFHLSGVDKQAFLAGIRADPAAAGIAAALSVRTGQPLHELDAGLVQAELDRQGVRYQ